MCVFAYMYICVCIAIVHIHTVLIFAICYIQSFMATLMVAPSPLLGSVSMKACTLLYIYPSSDPHYPLTTVYALTFAVVYLCL